jgi:lysozyme
MIDKRAFELVKKFEGFSEKAYICPNGYPTIGYGFRWVNGKEVKMGDKIDIVKATGLLYLELEKRAKEIEDLIDVPLNPQQLGALTSFMFNVGREQFRTSTLRKKLNQGDYKSVRTELLRWVKGEHKIGLTNRRKAEIELFFS